MTERIDHAAKACAIGVSLEEAQVHATLAVAEQLRVGNLIALQAGEVRYNFGGWSRLGSEIREGLGL